MDLLGHEMFWEVWCLVDSAVCILMATGVSAPIEQLPWATWMSHQNCPNCLYYLPPVLQRQWKLFVLNHICFVLLFPSSPSRSNAHIWPETTHGCMNNDWKVFILAQSITWTLTLQTYFHSGLQSWPSALNLFHMQPQHHVALLLWCNICSSFQQRFQNLVHNEPLRRSNKIWNNFLSFQVSQNLKQGFS